MQAEVTIKFRYEIPDDLEERKRIYEGHTDPQECCDVDATNPAYLLMDLAQYDPEVAINPVDQ
jgi:hypothetical protein